MASPLADLVLRQMEFTFGANDWHASLSQLLDSTSPAQAVWRPEAGGHTIWENLHHLAYSARLVAARLRGAPAQWDPAQGWVSTPERVGPEEWAAAKAALKADRQELISAVAVMDDAALTTPGPDGQRPLDLILQIIPHEAYHAGQIAYIRRLQGLAALM